MKHITINTGNSIGFLEPIFVLDKLEVGPLPEPYDRFGIDAVFGDDDWLYFDLSLDGEHITANLVCQVHQEDGWLNMIGLYLQIYGALPPVQAYVEAPYLATVVLPNQQIFQSGDLVARIEQAIALSAC